MAKDSSALTRVDELHVNNNQNDASRIRSTRHNAKQNNNGQNGIKPRDGRVGHEPESSNSIINEQAHNSAEQPLRELEPKAIKERARALIDNKAIDAETRSILKYGLEIDDPVLEELVCMVERVGSLDDNLPATTHNSNDEFITTHRSRNDLMKSERVEKRSDVNHGRHDYSHDYSIEYELAECESMLDQRDDEFPDDPDYLPTEAGNGNGGGLGTANVCSSFDDEPEPLGPLSDSESFELYEQGLIEDPIDAEEIEDKLRKLTSLICRAGNEPEIKSAALLSLVATLWYAPDFVKTARLLALMHCCELDLYGIVDSQIEMIEQELMATAGA
ncbi:MAG TPA: hypothetical protein VI306_08660 [Pyrinomonadaceae bacterium]